MIRLDDTELKLKEDIDIIFSGGYDVLNKEQVEYCKEFSFLFNHITFSGNDLLFKYGNFNLKISNIPDEELFLTYEMIKDQVIYSLRNSSEFKMAYKQFLRDYKIDKLL